MDDLSRYQVVYDEQGNILEKRLLTDEEIKQVEMLQLKKWYDIYYTQHEQKYRRTH